MNNQGLVGIIVDAGHGGLDSGAVGNNLLEKDLTLQAATYMFNRLQELGIPAKMTRTNDEYLPKEERIRRVKSLYNNSPNTILVSNHINAGKGEGAEIVYALKNNGTLANLALEYIGDEGQIKRKAYQRRLPENPNKDYYYILRETGNTEPILVEYGFIDNDRDANKLKNNLTNYVEGVVKALAEYTGYPYRPPMEEEEEAKDTYIVQKGDTLYSISRRFNIPIEELIRINKLKNNTLSIGQEILLINQPIEEGNIYTVKRGDTLYSIAIQNNTTVDQLKKWNNLLDNTISIGQELWIKPSPQEIPQEQEYEIYTVVKGDSLWNIAKEYNIPVTELVEMNKLSNLTLQIGQQLFVPKTEIITEDYYIVKKGDTLWSVAKENNLDVNTLKEINNLTSNLLTIGQTLKIK